jgi:CheY-like chemotaxis protein
MPLGVRRRLRVLLVEDDPADIRLLKEALAECGLDVDLVVYEDGDAALRWLKGLDAARRRVPDLIFLDLSQPGPGGARVLDVLKHDQRLRRIPALVFTGTKNVSELLRLYDLHANCCIAKPLQLGRLLDVIRSTVRFWFGTARLPTEREGV